VTNGVVTFLYFWRCLHCVWIDFHAYLLRCMDGGAGIRCQQQTSQKISSCLQTDIAACDKICLFS